jgi:DNA-binding response OmpR family regulator
LDNTQPHILLVDDDTELCGLLAEYLENEQFQVSSCHDGYSALHVLQQDHRFNAVVLDIMMPQINGLEVLQAIRAQHNIPVIMLTGRGGDIDRIVGLEMGADDYLGKPCIPRELAARLRAVLRRGQHYTSTDAMAVTLVLNGIELNKAQRQVKVHGEPLELTGAEFNVLALLMQSAGQVLSKKELTEKVLQRKLVAYDRSIEVHVSRLRQKLAKALQGKMPIKTIRGSGYQMVTEGKDINAE